MLATWIVALSHTASARRRAPAHSRRCVAKGASFIRNAAHHLLSRGGAAANPRTHLERPAVPLQACDPVSLPAATESRRLDITEIERRLQASSYFALRLVRCRLKNGTVTLDGRVPSYYLKQIAQTLVSDAGVGLPIENRLEVA
jgi:hypothetical protein